MPWLEDLFVGRTVTVRVPAPPDPDALTMRWCLSCKCWVTVKPDPVDYEAMGVKDKCWACSECGSLTNAGPLPGELREKTDV